MSESTNESAAPARHTPDQVKFINFILYGSGVFGMAMAALQAFAFVLAAIPSFGITCLMLPIPAIIGGVGYWAYARGESLIGENGHQEKAPDDVAMGLMALMLCGSIYHFTAGLLVVLLLKKPGNRAWYQG